MAKFSVIIGNPPYKQNLHLKFLNLALDISKDFVAFIQPARWIINGNKRISNKKKFDMLIKDKISKCHLNLELHNGRKLFPGVLIGNYVGIFYINKKKVPGITVTNLVTHQNYQSIDIYSLEKYGNSKIYLSLRDKILKMSKIKNLGEPGKKVGNYFVNFARMRGHTSSKESLWKDDFYTFVAKTYEVELKIKPKARVEGFEIKSSAENFLNYLKTDFARFALSIFKMYLDVDNQTIEAVPYLDFTQAWDDEKLYKEFNLTEEEVAFIEKNIPKYY